MMKRLFAQKILIIAVICFCATGLSSCRTKENETKPIGIVSVLLTDQGGIRDGGLNAMAWNSHLEAQKTLGYTVESYTVMQGEPYGTQLERIRDNRMDMLWGIGQKAADAFIQEAGAFPERKYLCMDAFINNTTANIQTIGFEVQEAAYLAGYLAAKMSETGVIGFLGGFPGAESDQYLFGYMAGARRANSQVKISIEYTQDYADKEKGRASATALYEEGSDIILTAAYYADFGCYEIARAKNIMVIATEYDKQKFSDSIIASVVKRTDNVVLKILQDYAADKSIAAGHYKMGLGHEAVTLQYTEKATIPDALVKNIEALQEDIIQKKIVPPKNQNEFNQAAP